MAALLELFHDDDVNLLDAGHPLLFGTLDKGTTSPTQTIHLWNHGDVNAVAPHVLAMNADDDTVVFAGTALNGNVSMLECRSCAATGVPADQQEDWTPIGPTQILTIGDIPPGAMRTLELRIKIPVDSATLSLRNLSLTVSA